MVSMLPKGQKAARSAGSRSHGVEGCDKGSSPRELLSPQLFNIFVRELPQGMEAEMMQFADDTTNTTANVDPQVVVSKLSNSFYHTKSFCESHELIINKNKTQLIIFNGPGRKLPESVELVLDGCSIQPSATGKLLGVTLDRRLTIDAHIDEVVKKCHGQIGVLARSAIYLPRKLLHLAYIALLRNHLEYCSAVFVSEAPSHLKKLNTMQRIAARIICGVPRDAHSAPLLLALELDPLADRRNAHVVKLVKPILEDTSHPALKGLFRVEEDGSVTNDLK
jgi:hypothetical protein